MISTAMSDSAAIAAGAGPLDLLPPHGRWTPSRKEKVVQALAQGRVGRDQVIAQLGVSAEELTGWEARHNRLGQAGLKTTTLQGTR